MSAERDNLVSALIDAIDRVPNEYRDKLADALDAYARAFPMKWAKLANSKSLEAELLDAICDASGALAC